MQTCERFDVVVVPFPFTDGARQKRRPALVLSQSDFNEATGHCVLAMITSADNPPWSRDVMLQDLNAAGLSAPSVLRMKFFTLDARFVIRVAGRLGDADQTQVADTLASVLF
jgi:mRNA interferase MazF